MYGLKDMIWISKPFWKQSNSSKTKKPLFPQKYHFFNNFQNKLRRRKVNYLSNWKRKLFRFQRFGCFKIRIWFWIFVSSSWKQDFREMKSKSSKSQKKVIPGGKRSPIKRQMRNWNRERKHSKHKSFKIILSKSKFTSPFSYLLQFIIWFL